MVTFGVQTYPFFQFADLGELVEFVRRADELGYAYAAIPEHIIFPVSHEHSLGKTWWDPIVLATHLAGITRTIRFSFGILILPQHEPIVLAKQIATLDQVSGGRVSVGIGVGWLREEAEMLGVDFHRRGAMADEYIRVMKCLWTAEPATFSGRFVSFTDASFHPRPVQQPHPPIFVGGSVATSVPRAAALGDGWVPMLRSAGEMEEGVKLLHAELRRHGRAIENFPIMQGLQLFPHDPAAQEHIRESVHRTTDAVELGHLGGDHGRAIEFVHRFAALGVTHFTVTLPLPTQAERLRELEAFARNVMQQV